MKKIEADTPLQQTPIARSRALLVEVVDNETLVYDLESHDAHCLNQSAVLVWEACDGSRTVADLADILEEHGFPEPEALVWMALERLDRSALLESAIELPDSVHRYSRKEAMRMMGRAAGLTLVAPLVTSIVAPLAAQAASCLTNAQCHAMQPPNCTGLPICRRANRCCSPIMLGGRSVCRQRPC